MTWVIIAGMNGETKLSEELAWRGFVNQTTFKDATALDKEPLTFYFGVDPSADSMTIGNLASAMMVKHFVKHGHKAILLIGGATGLIGDPDGKAQERDLKTKEEIARNKAAIVAEYQAIFGDQTFELVDNYDWFKNISYLGFLRDVGKHVPMRQMLARDFVQTRLSEAGAGVSYAEFSYALIQGYDFLHLYREKGVTLQVCGSDQWGNSIAGVELVRRVAGGEAHIWSAPLVVNKTTGVKFGKSEEGAVWLAKEKTSVYDFYQFWLNADDAGVEDYLKIYTMLEREEIDEIMQTFSENRAERQAQKILAFEVTKLIHGEEAASDAREASSIVVGSARPSDEQFARVKSVFPVIDIDMLQPLVDALVAIGLAESKTAARRFIQDGAIYINNQKVNEEKVSLDVDDCQHDIVILRRGKNKVVVAGKK